MTAISKMSARALRKAVQDPHLNDDLLLKFLEERLKLGGLVNKHTMRAYKRYIAAFCEGMRKARAERGEQHGYRLDTYLLEQGKRLERKEISAATYNQCVSAIRAVARIMGEQAAYVKGLDKVQQVAWADQYMQVMRVIQRVREPKRRRVGQWLSLAEVERLFNSVDRHTTIGKRDMCLLALAFGGGLRREEMAGVCRKQMKGNYNGRPMIVGLSRKGGKTQEVPLARWAYELVADWLSFTGMGDDGRVLRRVSKDGVVGESLTTEAVYQRMELLCERAGVRVGCPIRPHDARRTCAGMIVEAGGSIKQAQLQLGHSNVNTTAQYLSSIMEVRPGEAGVDKVKVEIGGDVGRMVGKVTVKKVERELAMKLIRLAQKGRGIRRVTLVGGIRTKIVEDRVIGGKNEVSTPSWFRRERARYKAMKRMKERQGYEMEY